LPDDLMAESHVVGRQGGVRTHVARDSEIRRSRQEQSCEE
jgi:hypothetical protein